MARAHLYKPIVDSLGNLRTGVQVRVLDPGTTNPVSIPLYVGPTGASQIANPFIASLGIVNFYTEDPVRVRLGVTVGSDPEIFFDDVDVDEPFDPDDFAPAVHTHPYPVVQKLIFSRSGSLEVEAGSHREYVEYDGSITISRASLGVPATGGPVVVHVMVNGVMEREITIAAGANTAVSTVAIPVLADDYITIDVNQVGVSTPGDDLTVSLRLVEVVET